MGNPLDSIHESCQRITSRDFDSPGIFTNAIISRPDFRALIRDTRPSERALYRITKASGVTSSMVRRRHTGGSNEDAFVDLKPERVDGKSAFKFENHSKDGTLSVVVPQLQSADTPKLPSNLDQLSSPTRRRVASYFKLLENSESMDIDTLCETVLAALEQHANMDGASAMKEQVTSVREEFRNLTHEIEILEHTVSERRQHLERHNEGIPNSPVKGILSPTKSLSVVELIRKEEETILELERELNSSG